MSNTEPEVVAEFHRCPVCGSNQSFAMSVAAEQQEKGLIRDSLGYSLDQMGGLIIDRQMVNNDLVGTPIPVIRALIDICLNCGNVYAVRLEREDSPLRSASEPWPVSDEELRGRG